MNEGKREVDYRNYKKEITNWFFKVSDIVKGKKGFEIFEESIPHEGRQNIDYDEHPITRPRRTIKFEKYEIVYDDYTKEVELYEDGHGVKINQERRLDLTYHILKRIYDKYNDSEPKNIDNHRCRVTKELAEIFINPAPGDKEKAIGLINDGYVYLVAKTLGDYQGLDDEIAKKMIEYGYGWAVFSNKHLFIGLKLGKEEADKMVENGEGYIVVSNIEDFEGVKLDKIIALRVIEDGDGDYVERYAKKFEGLDKEVAEKLVEKGYRYYVDKNPELFGLKNENKN